jgi:hypothetical protein
MNYTDRTLREIAAFSPLDVMLADIAVRVQLSPTDYQKAIDHYHAIHEWLEREDSPLYGLVEEFYTRAVSRSARRSPGTAPTMSSTLT